jgi:protein-tyrosine-phosphatase
MAQGAAVAPEKPATNKGAAQKQSAAKGRKLPKEAEHTTPFDDTVAAVSAPGANVASARTKAARKASRKKNAPKTKGKAKATRERSNKKADVIAMMKRAKGATLAEIMAAAGWQAHTVRGFVSILGSNEGQKIESSKNAAGERTYKIVK